MSGVRSNVALLVGVLLALSLAGCAQLGNSELQFTPSEFPECKGPDIVVDVAWDATSHTKDPVHIMVYKPGQSPKVWLEGPPSGHSKTGKWMADGSTMKLVDAHGTLLAMRTLETVPCADDAGH